MASGKIAPLIVGLCLTAAVITGLLVLASRIDSSSSFEASATEKAVLVSGVELKSSTASRARLGFNIRWPSTSFPGIFRCSWEALGPGGAVVGTYSTEVVSLQPSISDQTIELDTTSVATNARAACGPDRLDDGRPYAYSFANVTATSPEEGVAMVTYEAVWQADSYPGVVTCSVEVLGPEDRVLESQVFNIHVGPSAPLESDLRLVAEGLTTVTGGRIRDCQPFNIAPPV
jgi:hypothetical protein